MSAAALSPLLATLAIAALLAACTSLASALTTPLPPVYPPTTRTNTTASGKYSTNLAALYFNDNTVAMQRAVNRSFSRLDTDRDGSLSIHELTSAINRTAEDGGDVLPAGIAAQMSAVNGKLAQMDTDRNGVISQQEFGTVLATALTKNFTIFPAICLEVQERLALCQLDPAQNVTDPNLPTVDGGQPATATIGQIAAREANKCASGAAGLQGDFAFQNCVLGNTCGDLIVNCFSQVMSGADAVFTAATNRFLDDQIPALTGLPSDDPTFRAYMTEGTQVSAKEAALQVFGTTVEGGVLAGLMTVLGKLLMDAIIPLLAKEATWAAIATFITGLGPHAWFIFLGVSFGLGVLALIVMQFKNLVEIVRGLWPRNDYNRLMMDSYDPYDVNSIGPRCNWATYFPNGSSSPDSLEKDLWGVCDKGGMPYLPNECSKQQWKYFYQRYIPFRRCTHLCLRTDVQCGEDNYFYRNTTEFLYQPTAAVNPLMFAPSFSGKQYGVVDQRFVYQMDQCREACNRLTFRSGGFSPCVGFVLQAPNPMLDKRPSFQFRQVCSLLGVQEFNADRAPGQIFPIKVVNANSVFGYDVVKSNQYPPLVVGFRK